MDKAFSLTRAEQQIIASFVERLRDESTVQRLLAVAGERAHYTGRSAQAIEAAIQELVDRCTNASGHVTNPGGAIAAAESLALVADVADAVNLAADPPAFTATDLPNTKLREKCAGLQGLRASLRRHYGDDRS